MRKTILAAAAILVASSAPSFAQHYPGNSDVRQHNQYQRIHQGVRSGELTRGEAHRLYAQQQGIDRYQRQAMADGHLSRDERWQLRRMQVRASDRIHNYKNNMRDRW